MLSRFYIDDTSCNIYIQITFKQYIYDTELYIVIMLYVSILAMFPYLLCSYSFVLLCLFLKAHIFLHLVWHIYRNPCLASGSHRGVFRFWTTGSFTRTWSLQWKLATTIGFSSLQRGRTLLTEMTNAATLLWRQTPKKKSSPLKLRVHHFGGKGWERCLCVWGGVVWDFFWGRTDWDLVYWDQKYWDSIEFLV